MNTSRRDFLGWSLRSAALLLAGGLARPAAAQKLLDVIPFAGERRRYIGTVTGVGLTGRRAFDPSTLTSQKLVVPNDQFFIRTRYPPQIDPEEPWQITIDGLVERPRTMSPAELLGRAEPLGVHLLECSGSTSNSYFGLMGAADWRGVPLAGILARSDLKPAATRVLVTGVDPKSGPGPGASWIFTLEDLERAGAALATHINGEPLPKDHGHPVRLIVPGWYGCAWIKWVDRITLVDDAAPATAQMREYASRTQQAGRPALARDYRPATIDQAAMPVRVEMWEMQGKIVYRVVGVLWGGEQLTDSLRIRFDPDPDDLPVKYEHQTNRTWTLWSCIWRPARPGRYSLRLKFYDPQIRTRRMDQGHYTRSVEISEV